MSGFFDVVFENDDFTVNVVSEFLKSFSDLESVDRTEDGACCAGLCSDGEAYAFESGGESFSFSLDLCELVGALTSSLYPRLVMSSLRIIFIMYIVC